MPGTIAPFPKHQFFDNNGDPAASHLLFTYSAGTATKLSTYSDSDLTVANANPIVLDSAGRATIFLSANSYKFVLAPAADTDPPASPIWTVDGVSSLAAFNVNVDIPVLAGEALGFAEVCFMADGAGGLTAGSWYRANATNYWSSVTAPVLGFPTANIASGATGTVRIAGRVPNLASLATGSRYYVSTLAGALTTSLIGARRLVGQADSATSLILLPSALQFRQLHVQFGLVAAGALTTGIKKYIYVSHPMLVLGWTLIGDQSGSCVIDVWSDTYANFPPTVADSIAGSELPTLTTQQINQDSVSTWTFLIPAGNVLAFNISSAATVNEVNLILEVLMV